MFSRLRFPIVAALVVAAIAAAASLAAAGSGGAARPTPVVRPVIGQPVTLPAQPVPGQRFAATFKVTRSDTGRPLTAGKMLCDPSVAGEMIGHTDSFTGGVARLAFVVPISAQGKQLKVKLTIKLGAQSATRIASFAVKPLPKPSVSITGASVTEGNGGAATLSIPVALSAATPLPVSVSYATADGTATAGSDYTAASGTVAFAPGETAKTIAIAVTGDTAVEQDEAFTVTLSNAVNATIAGGTATGTITSRTTTSPRAPVTTPGRRRRARRSRSTSPLISRPSPA